MSSQWWWWWWWWCKHPHIFWVLIESNCTRKP
jgi:hypothetical protein